MMKYFYYVFMLSLIVICSSCVYKTKVISEPVVFDNVQKKESYFIENSKFGCNVDIDFTFPDTLKNTQDVKSLLKVMTELVLGEVYANEYPDKAVDQYYENYVNKFKYFAVDVANTGDENSYEDETGYTYYIKVKDTVTLNQNNIVSFTVETLSYEGGAHSTKSIYGYTYSMTDNCIITENDFAGEKYSEIISLLLTNKIIEENNLKDAKDLENIGYNIEDIKPNNNFSLNDKGITYYFNEGEIAGNMIGITSVFMSYDELSLCVVLDSPISSLISY
ncbi:hypothetical protein M2138_001530 [Dysgonomonadaceae bacterium PH5-43]|nr:hypothetical protein [Dysgonomonadaceae bacterium PH5-43]